MSPGGLGSGGGVVRRRVLGMMTAPVVKKEMEEEGSENKEKDKGKGKGVAGKKRPAPKKMGILHDESSDDEFNPDPASPTTHKRRRTTLTITDSPTATSTRPSRTAPITTSHSSYIAPSSPSTSSISSSSKSEAPSTFTRPSTLNSEHIKTAWQLDGGHPAPTGRIQELLEQHGVNTPENRYDEHFLQRHTPVVTNPVISIPAAVKRMADPTPRLSAEQKVDLRNKAHFVRITFTYSSGCERKRFANERRLSSLMP